jgi:hypothetical protein
MKSTSLIAAAGQMLAAPDALAASCSGTGRNGEDPVAAGCSSTTVADTAAMFTVWPSQGTAGFIAPGTPGNHWGNRIFAPGCARGEVLYVDADGVHRTARLQSSDC